MSRVSGPLSRGEKKREEARERRWRVAGYGGGERRGRKRGREEILKRGRKTKERVRGRERASKGKGERGVEMGRI